MCKSGDDVMLIVVVAKEIFICGERQNGKW